MQIRYYAYFDTKGEKTEFINLLRNCKNDIEAINAISKKYPDLPLTKISGIVENFKQYINNHETE